MQVRCENNPALHATCSSPHNIFNFSSNLMTYGFILTKALRTEMILVIFVLFLHQFFLYNDKISVFVNGGFSESNIAAFSG